jgi:hypothetical protein
VLPVRSHDAVAQPPESVHARLLQEWRSAACFVSAAWEDWRVARAGERAHAHAVYVAALAEEEIAADRLQRHVAAGGLE